MKSSRTLVTCLLFVIASVLLTGAQPADAESYLSPGQHHLTVNCPKGSIGKALERAAQMWPFGRVTITVRGVCVEEVIISRDETTLRGASPGDGLQAPSPTSFVLVLIGRQIELQQLTLTGGSRGLVAGHGASFYANELYISETADEGVLVDTNSVGDLHNSRVENSGDHGLEANSGGVIRMHNGVIDNNTYQSVVAKFGGHITLDEGTVVRNSGQNAVTAHEGGSILISNATVEDSIRGVYALSGGHVTVEDGSLIQNNAHGGVAADGGSTISLRGGSRVKNNPGRGVLAGSSSSLVLQDVIIEQNGNDGIYVIAGATVRFDQGTIVQNNTGHGIALAEMSAAIFHDDTVQVIGNTGTAVICFPGSVAQIVGAPGTISGNGSDVIDCPQSFP